MRESVKRGRTFNEFTFQRRTWRVSINFEVRSFFVSDFLRLDFLNATPNQTLKILARFHRIAVLPKKPLD